jgi:hypothetical protein
MARKMARQVRIARRPPARASARGGTDFENSSIGATGDVAEAERFLDRERRITLSERLREFHAQPGDQ